MDKFQFIAAVIGVISAITGLIAIFIIKKKRWIGIIGLAIAAIFAIVTMLIPNNLQFIEPPSDSTTIYSKKDQYGNCTADIKIKVSPFFELGENEYIILLFKLKSGSSYLLQSMPIPKSGIIDNIAHFQSVAIGHHKDPITTWEIIAGTTGHKYSSLKVFNEMPNTIIQHERIVVSRKCE